jgi:hypothetical protein
LNSDVEHNKTRAITTVSNQHSLTLAPSTENDLTLLLYAGLSIVFDSAQPSRKREALCCRFCQRVKLGSLKA